MITEPKTSNASLFSAWCAGIALLCLGIGMHGATTPLMPANEIVVKSAVTDDTVMVETFQPPAAAAATEESPPEPETKEEDVEIPPLPQITPPLTPPEMVEITPLDEATPPPEEKEPAPPKPATTPKPTPRPATKPAATAGNSDSDSGNSPVTFNRAGSAGRFPDPAYPASARSAKQQGTVRLLVTVEASGMASAVEVTTSSGSITLDRAASDTISRRWRWPAGTVRKFIIPIRFVLQ